MAYLDGMINGIVALLPVAILVGISFIYKEVRKLKKAIHDIDQKID